MTCTYTADNGQSGDVAIKVTSVDDKVHFSVDVVGAGDGSGDGGTDTGS